MRRDIAAVIFDLDGLVLDTEPGYFRAWQQAAVQLGFELSDAFCAGLSGLHYQAVEQRIAECGGDNFDARQFRQLSSELWRQHVERDGIAVKPGFFELLAIIRQAGLLFALATNSDSANARLCLQHAGLATVFSLVVGREQVEHGKPAPDIFLETARLLAAPIERCLVLEDSPTGVAAALVAAAQVIFVPSVAEQAGQFAAVVHRFADLQQVADFLADKFDHV